MPRKSRIDVLGALHHIINRGIERRDLGKTPISKIMMQLLTGYALSYTGESEFVEQVLKKAQELERHLSSLKQSGITETKIIEIISGIFEIKVEKIFIHTKDCIVVGARRLYCFWGG